jgi:hypothetical protein
MSNYRQHYRTVSRRAEIMEKIGDYAAAIVIGVALAALAVAWLT